MLMTNNQLFLRNNPIIIILKMNWFIISDHRNWKHTLMEETVIGISKLCKIAFICQH